MKRKDKIRKKAVNDVVPSRFFSRFTFHLSRSLWPKVLLIAAVALIAYSNTFHVPFHFDDMVNIKDNSVIKNLGNFISSQKGYDYNPRRVIGYLSFALNYHFGGLDVTGYHIVNLAIHILSSILVYFLVTLTFRTPFFTGKKNEDEKMRGCEGEQKLTTSQLLNFSTSGNPAWIALFSSLLFAVHPLQTQAVTYIVQRFASLAAMFYLLSVVMYIKGRIGESENRRIGKKSRFIFFAISFLSAVLAMKTKETAFTLPIIIILYEFCFFSATSPRVPDSPIRRVLLSPRLLYLLPILLTMLIIPAAILGTDRPLSEIISDLSERLRAQTHLPRWDYLMTQMRVITTYIRLIFLPVNQNLDYDYPVYHSLFELPVFLSFVFLSLLFGLGVYLIIKQVKVKTEESLLAVPQPQPQPAFRLIGFGILWFFITLSVESSFIPIADVIFEHRLYLPLAGALIAVTTSAFVVADKLAVRFRTSRNDGVPGKSQTFGGGNDGVPGKSQTFGGDNDGIPAKAVTIAFALITIAFSFAAYARNMVRQDGVSLWQDVVSKSPGNARAYNNLGFEYMNKKQFDNAISEIQTAIRLKPEYEDAYFNLGVTYKSLMMLDRAKEEFLIALKLAPNDPDAHYNLGLVYQNENMPDKALEQYNIAIKLKPDYADAYSDLARLYRMQGMFADALRNLQIDVQLRPDNAAAHFNLGLVYYDMGQMENARQELTAGLRIKPDNLQAQQLLKRATGK
ncbi:MAG: tetratricopeptide repeat protein [Dissulfurispiraceae bacterium]